VEAQALPADSSEQTLGRFGGHGNTTVTSIPQSNSVNGSFGSNDDSKPAAKAASTAFAGFGSPSAALTAPVQATAPIPGDSTQNESKPVGTDTAFPSFGGFGSSTAPTAATSFLFGGATEASMMATTMLAGATTGGAFLFNSGGVAAAAAPATPQPTRMLALRCLWRCPPKISPLQAGRLLPLSHLLLLLLLLHCCH
jgi:hypothetical protein